MTGFPSSSQKISPSLKDGCVWGGVTPVSVSPKKRNQNYVNKAKNIYFLTGFVKNKH